MAWWDSLDVNFKVFLENLFEADPQTGLGDQQDSRYASGDLPPNAFVATDPKLPKVVASVAADATKTVKKGLASPPSAVAPVTATPTPSPSPSTSSPAKTTPEQAVAKMAEQAKALFAAQQKPQAPQGITDQSPVWIPKWEVYKGQQDIGKGRFLPTTVGAALEDFQTWNDKKLRAFSEKLVRAGVLDEPTINHEKLEPFWESLVGRSAKMYAAGRKMNPWDILSRLSAEGGGATTGPRTVTSTSTQYTVTSALTAKQLAHAALSQRLGRDATDAEVVEFTKALAAAEKKNPTTTTTTTTTDQKAGTQTSNSTTHEGLDPKGFAMDYGLTHNKEEAAAFQAAGFYMPAFFEALGAPI
ncbi:hypothetical protein ABZ470_23705 [Streptosporangium sp. NPDC020072]|uniref:hypothetical protein n=1 Tax=Streptosporangium sp. NPDC020072 TaxID=3154788 RepID=UPI0034472012